MQRADRSRLSALCLSQFTQRTKQTLIGTLEGITEAIPSNVPTEYLTKLNIQ